MAANETLGINIQLTTNDAINNIKTLMDQLQGINKAVANLGSAGANGFKGLGDESEKTQRRVKVVAEALGDGGLIGQIKLMNTISKDLKLAKVFQDMSAATKGATDRVSGLQAAIESMNAKAREAKQQLSWNAQAGTQGVKYQPTADNSGFVRASVQTTNLSSDAMKRLQAEAVAANTAMQKMKPPTSIFDRFNLTLGSVTKRLIEFYSIRTGVFAFSGQISEAITTLLDLNQILHDTLAITAGSPANFMKMEQAALSMAKHTKFSAVEVSKAMQTLAQAGVSDKDLTDVTQVATMLATGTGATIDQASKILTTGMNVWKIDAKDSIQIANVLTGALNASKLEISELGTAFNYLANQSALMGQSMTQTVSIIGVMRNQGVEASTIGTSMSQMMKVLEAPTPRFEKLLKAYQIDPESIRPTQHTMVEIVKVFEDAAKKLGNNSIAMGDLFKGLETRVGRGFATLIQAGSQALVEMEAQIKNTNAVAIAWAEHMKGARAQLNILKSELVETVSALSPSSDTFLAIAENMRNLIVGLRSGFAELGEVVLGTALAIEALYVAFSAIATHPVGAAITLIGAALITLIAKTGEYNREIAASFDTLNTAIAASSRDYKNATEGLNGLNRAIKENKRDSAGNIEVGEQYRQVLYDLIQRFPDLKKHLGDEAKLQAIVTAELARQNAERRETLRLEMLSFNSLAYKAAGERKEYATKFKSITGNELPADADVATTRKKVQEYKDKLFALNPERLKVRAELETPLKRMNETESAYMQSAKIMKGSPQVVLDGRNDPIYKTALFDPNATNPVNTQKPNNDTNRVPHKKTGGGGGAKAEARAEESMDNLLSDTMNSLNTSIEEDVVKKVENEIALVKDSIGKAAKKGDATAYNEALDKYTDALDEGVGDQLAKWDIQFKSNLAKRMHAEYDPADNTFSFPDTEKGNRNRQNWKEYWTPERDALYKKAYASKDARYTNDANKKVDELPEFEAKAKITDSLRSEKEADRALTITKAGLAIRKEEARSAQELQDIELVTLAAEEKATATKAAGYTKEIGEREIRLAELRDQYSKDEIANSQKLTDEVKLHSDKLEEINDKLRAANDLLELQKVKRADKENQGTGYNLKKGWDAGITAVGTEKDLLQAMGKETASSTFNGITDSVNNMVTALSKGKNAWNSFSDTLKSITITILESIQKQIIKMMLLSVWQKITGMVSGVDASGAGGETGIADVFGGFAKGGLVQKFATGGLALNGGSIPNSIGTPGVDSVPAMLMPGEFVIPKRVVDKYGVAYFEQMRTQKFAEGGVVGAAANSGSTAASSKGKGGEFVLNIINVADPSSIPKTTGQDVLNVISFETSKRGPVFKQLKAAIAGG